MANMDTPDPGGVALAPARTLDVSQFGILALSAAGASLLFCYAQILISLLAPMFGMQEFQLNIHLQAICMWGFALVTSYGLYRDRDRHGSNIPLMVSALAVIVIIATLYAYYDIRILILGYVLLFISALLNQSIMLASLNKKIENQSTHLQKLNVSLEKRVETQVAEIDKLARLKRFLSSEIADLITTEGQEGLLNSHRSQIACMFCDLRNFTTFSDQVEPEDVLNVLQDFHKRSGQLIDQRKGTIGYRAGDGVMVVFNDPLPCEEPVEEAIALALEMISSFAELREHWEELGHQLGMGIGIAYGYATLGTIGSDGRIDYTAIGNTVNIASRLCDTAQNGEVLIDQRAYLEVKDRFDTEPAGEMNLKGVRAPVQVHRVIAGESD